MIKRNKGLSVFYKAFFHINFVTFALSLVAIPLLLDNANVINNALGIETQVGSGSENGGNYYNTKFEKMDDVKKASLDIIEETMKEGAVLLKNENNALPLQKDDTVTLYGAGSYYTVITGQGSSGVYGSQSNWSKDYVSLYQGLTDAGLNVNAELNNWYKDNTANAMGTSGTGFMAGKSQESQFVVKDIAWDALPNTKNNEAKAAIMVISRTSGEAQDLYMDTTMDDGSTRVVVAKKGHNDPSKSVGDALALNANEMGVLRNLKSLKSAGTIDKIIVLMNSAAPLQAEFIDDNQYGIDACMWVGTVGSTGNVAIGKLLTGEYNPSGKTSDTFWANSKYNPVYYNVGSMPFGNKNSLSTYFSTMGYVNNHYYAVYQEGIYNGYKYTETRYEDKLLNVTNVGDYDYSKVVSYPFGFGLSYADFEYSNMKVTENSRKDTYTITVDVKNVGSVAGKETVQAYVQKAYTQKDIQNGVEKASVELVGFDKVYVEPGAKVTATIEVKGKYFAAYDADGEKTYVIGSSDKKDEYLLTVAKDSHDAINNILQYKASKGISVDTDKIVVHADRTSGDKELVWNKYFAYDKAKYSTNEFIKNENKNFTPLYEGHEANYGVDKITNQFEDVDFKKAGTFSDSEEAQVYMSRSNWTGTYGKRITLTATPELKEAQKNPSISTDNIEYPKYGEPSFYTDGGIFDEAKLIYLRGKDYHDPNWETLLDKITWDEACQILQEGFRRTQGIDSISAPSSSQQNGAVAPVAWRDYGDLPDQSGFRGFVEELDPSKSSQIPPIFINNGIVAATYNVDLIERLGYQTGEEAAWAGFNGIYGLGVNIHRGNYCGRHFEYYSEDGFLTGVAAGYEAVGLHKMGVFVLAKHAIMNDQEVHRAGMCVYANEQSIREIYSRALEVAIEIDREYTPNTLLGVMTGMNRMGATWTGGQGFCNTVLRAEYGMRAYVVSDYNSSRPYMSPIQGVLYGNDLPDGNPAGNRNGYDYDGNDIRFQSYKEGYGELAWKMRIAVKNILYTVANSNAMNGLTGQSSFETITPVWEKALPVAGRVISTVFIWSAAIFGIDWLLQVLKASVESSRKLDSSNED